MERYAYPFAGWSGSTKGSNDHTLGRLEAELAFQAGIAAVHRIDDHPTGAFHRTAVIAYDEMREQPRLVTSISAHFRERFVE